MPTLRVLIENGQVCTRLLTKSLLHESVVADPTKDTSLPPSGPFWCVVTQSVLGPDGGHANADDCRPGRGCCQTA